MTDRILPPEEWHRLPPCELADAIGHLDPTRTTITVVEDGDQIVGCWAELWLPHLEGVWIHPDYRGKTSVARRLWRGMKRIVNGQGRTEAITAADSPEIMALLDRQRAIPLPQEYRLCL